MRPNMQDDPRQASSSKGRTWKVAVIDMFNYMDPEDGEELVEGFESPEAAIEYARRRVRSSVEHIRTSATDAEDLRSRWFMFGEDCIAYGTGYRSLDELDDYIANPASREETDWMSLEPDPRMRASLLGLDGRRKG